MRTRRFVINERSCSDRPAGARGCGPLTGCSGRGSVTCGPDGGERSSSSSPTPFSGGIDEGFGAIGAGRVGRADPVGRYYWHYRDANGEWQRIDTLRSEYRRQVERSTLTLVQDTKPDTA